jgi:hypothetical protein
MFRPDPDGPTWKSILGIWPVDEGDTIVASSVAVQRPHNDQSWVKYRFNAVGSIGYTINETDELMCNINSFYSDESDWYNLIGQYHFDVLSLTQNATFTCNLNNLSGLDINSLYNTEKIGDFKNNVEQSDSQKITTNIFHTGSFQILQ